MCLCVIRTHRWSWHHDLAAYFVYLLYNLLCLDCLWMSLLNIFFLVGNTYIYPAIGYSYTMTNIRIKTENRRGPGLMVSVWLKCLATCRRGQSLCSLSAEGLWYRIFQKHSAEQLQKWLKWRSPGCIPQEQKVWTFSLQVAKPSHSNSQLSS